MGTRIKQIKADIKKGEPKLTSSYALILVI
jgi:hypothetical protein